MLSLSDRLRECIRREGAMSFYDWMKAALYDPELGYYCSADRERWGRAGDYRTSPERSELFAATFARYFSHLHETLGAPDYWNIIEVGAGSGHFAAGVLQTLCRRFPKVFEATTYLIDDVGPGARARATELLAEFGERVVCGRLTELESIQRSVIFSNELLDAFPVHRVTVREGRLLEYFVSVNAAGSFEWTLRTPLTESFAQHFAQLGIKLSEGQVAEFNPGIHEWLKLASERLNQGYIVTVDYGAEAVELYDPVTRPGGTLRAFRQHRLIADLLARPGEQDLTSSVDWTLIRTTGEKLGLDVVEFGRQDHFLLKNGLIEELELRVSEAPDEAERSRLRTGAREMILPGGMAESFQVLVQKKR